MSRLFRAAMQRLESARGLVSSNTGRTVGLLAMIFVVAVGVLVVIQLAAPPRGDVALEATKACLQVAGVAVIGAFVAIITFNYQERQKQLAKSQEIDLDRFHEEIERQSDGRRRNDKFLRSMLMDTMSSYNAVKRNRRRLAAKAGGSHSIPISMETYHAFIAELNDQQLEFERLKVLAGVANDARLPQTYEFKGATYGDTKSTAIVCALATIEENLNDVIKEQRDRLAGWPENETLPVSTLEKTQKFLTGKGFDAVSHPKDVLVQLLQRALLEPLRRPTLEEFLAGQAEAAISNRPTY